MENNFTDITNFWTFLNRRLCAILCHLSCKKLHISEEILMMICFFIMKDRKISVRNYHFSDLKIRRIIAIFHVFEKKT